MHIDTETQNGYVWPPKHYLLMEKILDLLWLLTVHLELEEKEN